MITELPQKTPRFLCNNCDFKTNNKKDYSRHMLTSKHLEMSKMITQNCEKPIFTPILPQKQKYVCICGNEYKYNSGLSRHKQQCKNINNTEFTINANLDSESESDSESNFESNSDSDSESKSDSYLEPSSKDIIKMMKMQMVENQEIRNLIIELLKKETINNNIINNNNNNNISNCNNKSFNLNVFLNEQCKDALNIDEFVDSIKMNLSDLEDFANLGYADGVSNIFSKGIKALGIHLRPIHCSDTKREVLYIKNNDEWVKETDDKPLIIKAIKKVAFKNIKQINEWVKENPSCKDPRTKKYDKYNKIVMNAMSGVTEQEQHDNIEKIVKNVTKSVAIDKYALK